MRHSPACLLIVSVPAGYDVDPQAWETLKQCAGEGYGAGVVLASPAFLRADPPLLLGDWGTLKGEALRELGPLIDAAFFSLDWLEAAM
ncbi:hypothetical protein QR90_08435 [Deinococcus radiopugnans]|uniref:Uncharacterized protein n=1 Tax=Deinococcus radiopugnans TaxID=57497 RepID=A0A0A7KG98_9DEIO|nr:hypothetical protein [Deinococcus radiopugnans]AIZ45125.1 hypothetical protein QR90_08435 [Deinococcus radiopugnans]